MVRQPAESKEDENDDEHLGHFPHLLLGPPVVLLSDGCLPLESPQCTTEVTVGARQSNQGQDVGDALQ